VHAGTRQADLIIGFEPAEAVRSLDYLKPDGTVIVARRAIKPTTDTLSDSGYSGESMLDFLKTKVKKLIIIDGEAICAECGTPRALNIALLGAAAASEAIDFTKDDIESAIHKLMPEKHIGASLKALQLGSVRA
jgi:indolepyruvate ferredoxin oxidoreductase beta subunit